MMWALAPMLVALRRRLGSLDVAMLNDRNVEAWVNTTNKRKTNGWRHLARTCLRRVGRAVNPHGFALPKKIGRSPIAQPYNLEVEAVFGQVAGLPRPGDKPGRLLVAGGGFGGGLNGVQLLVAETGDLREVGNGRLAIQVRGHNERLVPIRADWTEAVRQAARLAQERQGNGSSTRIIRAARQECRFTARCQPGLRSGRSISTNGHGRRGSLLTCWRGLPTTSSESSQGVCLPKP